MAIIRCDLDPDDFLVWKYPDTSPTYGSTIIVNETQTALLFNSGRLVSVLKPGPHLVESTNIPGIGGLFQDKSQSVPIEIWFFNNVASTNFKWGTQSPVEIRDIEYQMLLPIGGYGNYQIKLKDPQAFILQVVGVRNSFSVQETKTFLYPMVEMHVKDAIAETASNRSVFTISTQLVELSNTIKDKLKNQIAKFGISLEDFYFQNIAILSNDPSFEKVKEALSEAATISIKSKAISQNSEAYQLERKFDVLDKMAVNPGGGVSELAGLGVGIGAAAGLAQSLGGTFNANKEQNNPSASVDMKNKLLEAKELLDAGIINQEDYDKIKNKFLEGI